MKAVWKIFFTLLLIPVLILFWRMAGSLYEYTLYTTTTPATVAEWSITENEGHFQVNAVYHYEYANKNYTKKHTFSSPKYGNKAVAEAHLTDLKKETWNAYINAKSPAISTLQRLFPFKQIFQFLLGIGILLHFLFLYTRSTKYITS